MLIQIDHHSGVPIYRQVIDQIAQQIVTDGLKQGEQLETVRDLAARLNVNPMTISKAYSLLETQGLVKRKRGVGLFVADMTNQPRERIKDELLSSVLGKAAVTAIQLGVTESEAMEHFKKHYKEYKSNEWR